MTGRRALAGLLVVAVVAVLVGPAGAAGDGSVETLADRAEDRTEAVQQLEALADRDVHHYLGGLGIGLGAGLVVGSVAMYALQRRSIRRRLS